MKCVCCDGKVRALDSYDKEIKNEEDAVFKTIKRVFGDKDDKISYTKAENRMWGDGIVGNISAGYGSKKDGDCYVIAICDECVEAKKLNGTIAHVGDYMMPDYYTEHEEEEARKIWRRYNQLDDLLE